MSCVLPYRGQDAKYAGYSEPSEPYPHDDSSSYEGQWRKQQWEDGGDWKHRKTGSGWEKGWSSEKEWVEVPDPKQLTSNRMASRDRKRSPSKGRAAGGSPKADRSSGSSKNPGNKREQRRAKPVADPGSQLGTEHLGWRLLGKRAAPHA